MRDLVIGFIIGGGALYTLRQPWVGVLLWNWISLMNPHEGFGYAAADWPIASIVGGSLIVGTAINKDRQNPFVGGAVWWLLAFVLWTCITLPFSIHFDLSYPLWVRSMKIFFMLFISMALINTREKLDALVWVVVVSLGFFGVKGGLFTLATGGNYRVWGPGGFIGGNNEVALALVTTIPLMRYLHLRNTHVWVRRGLVAAMCLTAITCLGTYSRGAFLALGAMGAIMWWKGNQKFLWAVLFLALSLVVLSLMPDEWWARMGTIKTYDQDASAMGRINAWYMAFNLACDRLFGGGFMVWTDPVFARYAPVPDDVHAAHSIYFQILGEHGFIGLALFLGVGVSTLFTTFDLIRTGKKRPGLRWAADLGAMIQVSMVGYATAGAFLSLAYYDLPYVVMAFAVLAKRIALRQQEQLGKKDPATPAPRVRHF